MRPERSDIRDRMRLLNDKALRDRRMPPLERWIPLIIYWIVLGLCLAVYVWIALIWLG